MVDIKCSPFVIVRKMDKQVQQNKKKITKYVLLNIHFIPINTWTGSVYTRASRNTRTCCLILLRIALYELKILLFLSLR